MGTFMIKFFEKCEWQNGFTLNIKESPAWPGTQMSPTPMKALMLGCIDGAQKGGITSATTVFPAEIYTIKACVMENTEKGYTNRNIRPSSH
jgi:hypothetical protein